MLPSEFHINGRKFTRIVEQVEAERERAEALGGFDAPQFGTRLQDATLDELSAEIERRRKELTAWGKRVDEAAESAPVWASIGFAPTVARECCMRDWNNGEQRCADCPDEKFCTRTNWDELKDYRETSGDDECCGVFDTPVCDGCPDARVTGGDDADYDEIYGCECGCDQDVSAPPTHCAIVETSAIDAVVDMLRSQGISTNEIIRRLVGSPSIAQSITVNVDGDVTDGSSIAEAFNRVLRDTNLGL